MLFVDVFGGGQPHVFWLVGFVLSGPVNALPLLVGLTSQYDLV
jgi:hypothetical protein